ncbi:hypothetical protein TNIN_287671, partial [Trichonephila inaurata madagascariensis]
KAILVIFDTYRVFGEEKLEEEPCDRLVCIFEPASITDKILKESLYLCTLGDQIFTRHAS